MKEGQAVAPTLQDFLKTCAHEFAFLTSRYGFQPVATPAEGSANPFESLFEKDGWRVAVCGVSYGFALDVEVHSPDGRRASFHDMLPAGIWMSARQEFQRGQLGDIQCAGKCLRTYGDELLRGELQPFEAMFRLGTERVAAQKQDWLKQQREHALRCTLESADVAFRAKDYGKVVTDLTPFEDALPPAERKKLEISRARSRLEPRP